MIAATLVLGFSVLLVSDIEAGPTSKILSERIVFPLHLESRADTGERVVRITDDLVLNLEKTSLFGDEVTVIGFDDDNSEVAMSMPGHEAEKDLYHDAKRLAAVHLTHDDGFQVEGVLGTRLRIRPLPAAERSSEGHVAHLLFEVEEKRHHDAMRRIQRSAIRSRDLNSANISSRAEDVTPEERQAAIIYPELTIFCDAPFSEFFKHNYTKILRYMTVFITCVNLRYLSLTDPYVWPRPVYIVALNRKNEIYMALSGDDYVYDATTLDNMPKMLSNYYYYTATDISVTVTARDIISVYNGDTYTAGYAYSGTACTDLKGAITEETPGTYDGIWLFSHELAHVLGAQHDGDAPISNIKGHPGAYSCPWSEGYIMSYIDNRPENRHRFSYCSQLQIRHTAHYKGRECLLKLNVKEKIKVIYKLPSEMITLKNFCLLVRKKTKGELIYLPSSGRLHLGYMPSVEITSRELISAGVVDLGQEKCKVYCKEQHSSFRWIFDRPDGFSCYKGKVCYLGRCTTRPNVRTIYKHMYNMRQ